MSEIVREPVARAWKITVAGDAVRYGNMMAVFGGTARAAAALIDTVGIDGWRSHDDGVKYDAGTYKGLPNVVVAFPKKKDAAKLAAVYDAAARKQKQALIRKAYAYNDKARKMASCNALYMGSMATASLMSALGGEYGRDSLDVLIDNASDEQLDAGLARCENIIKHGRITP